jgi:Na+/H+ antiporter NhaC
MASGCDHIAHVRTQIPYALSIGVLSMLVGDIPTAFGLPPWIALLLGFALIAAAVFWLFRPVGEPAPEPTG